MKKLSEITGNGRDVPKTLTDIAKKDRGKVGSLERMDLPEVAKADPRAERPDFPEKHGESL